MEKYFQIIYENGIWLGYTHDKYAIMINGLAFFIDIDYPRSCVIQTQIKSLINQFEWSPTNFSNTKNYNSLLDYTNDWYNRNRVFFNEKNNKDMQHNFVIELLAYSTDKDLKSNDLKKLARVCKHREAKKNETNQLIKQLL